MNVFKFYKDKKNSDKETGLADATFKLTKNSKDAENITFVKTSNETATDDVYRVAKTGETGTVTTITSPKSGKFTIQGLGAGTTMIYLVGAVLVLGSGVVLVTKRRVKGK